MHNTFYLMANLEPLDSYKTSTTSHFSSVIFFMYLYIYTFYVSVPACFEIEPTQHCYTAGAICQQATWYLFYLFFVNGYFK